MIYLDTSVVLARLFAESASPLEDFWLQRFTSSRLLEYEVMNRCHLRGLDSVYLADARALVNRVHLLEMTPTILARALAPFPIPVRTLDGLHLATMHYLLENRQTFRLASYDRRLIAAAGAIGVGSVADM